MTALWEQEEKRESVDRTDPADQGREPRNVACMSKASWELP